MDCTVNLLKDVLQEENKVEKEKLKIKHKNVRKEKFLINNYLKLLKNEL